MSTNQNRESLPVSAPSSSWTENATEMAAYANMQHTQAILDCEARIRSKNLRAGETMQALKARHEALCSAQRLAAAPATFRYFGSRSLWNNLSPADRWQKTTVLQILNHKGDFCPELSEQTWIDSFYENDGRHDSQHGEKLVTDPDILLARSQRPEFARCHNEASIEFFLRPFVHDKDFLRRFVHNYPRVLECPNVLSEEDLNDFELFKAFCSSPHLPKVPTCQRLVQALDRFDTSLFQSAELVLFALHQGLHILDRTKTPLRDNREFALAVPDSMVLPAHEGSLQYFSRRLRSDRQVVLAFLQVDGASLCFVESELLSDDTVAGTALQNNARVVVRCGTARYEKEFMLKVFAEYRRTGEFDERLWDLVDPHDTDVAAAALASYCCCRHKGSAEDATSNATGILALFDSADVTPPMAKQSWIKSERIRGHILDPSVWLKAFRVKSSRELWQLLPSRLQKDASFVQKLIKEAGAYVDVRTVQDIQCELPEIAEAREFWLQLGCGAAFVGLPDSLKGDKEVVIHGSTLEPVTMLKVLRGQTILEDRDVVESLLQSQASVWRVLPNHVRSLYPELIAKAMMDQPSVGVGRTVDNGPPLPRDVLVHRDVAIAWCRLNRNLPPTLRAQDYGIYFDYLEDPDFMLEVVAYNLYWLKQVSKKLCSDKTFMRRAIEKDARALCWASRSLKKDFELQLKAFSYRPDLPFRFISLSYTKDPESGYGLIASFATKLREMLRENDMLEEIMADAANPLSSGNLTCLNQGLETTEVYKTTFQAYLLGQRINENELWHFRRASAHLLMWGF